MRIMVFDVPAVEGGALSVLKEFYLAAKECEDKNIEWIFVLSKPYFEETNNVKILRFPWIKKSWMHRVFFDQFIAKYLVSKYNVDRIFSLQNIMVPNVKKEQIIYMHQALPFIKYKFSLKENKLFWIYQNIIGRKIIKSVKKADKVIVQTKWIKNSIESKISINKSKISVVPPTINIKDIKHFKPTEESLYTLFYPANEMYYKNHRIIVESISSIIEAMDSRIKVFFTLYGNESDHIKELYKKVKIENLPIYFIGTLSKNEVFTYYSKSILIFPSYIETFGLPLLEQKLHGGIILASDTEFSHEILNNYPNVYFFDPFDESTLANIILDLPNLKYIDSYSDMITQENQNLIDIIISKSRTNND